MDSKVTITTELYAHSTIVIEATSAISAVKATEEAIAALAVALTVGKKENK